MDISLMREKVKSVYPTKTWSDRVDRMASNQVTAIYLKFLKTGKFNKPVLRRGNKYHQITIEEFLKREKETTL